MASWFASGETILIMFWFVCLDNYTNIDWCGCWMSSNIWQHRSSYVKIMHNRHNYNFTQWLGPLFYLVNAMTDDVLAPSVARTSAAMVSTHFSGSIQVPASQRSRFYPRPIRAVAYCRALRRLSVGPSVPPSLPFYSPQYFTDPVHIWLSHSP